MSGVHFKQLTIVGVGLIGGSLALAAKRAGIVDRVVGVGRSPASLARAIELGVVDEALPLAEAVAGADVVVVCVPVAQTFAVLHALEPHLGERTLVTDCGSTKSDVIVAAKTALGDKVAQFVPAHPIAGRERSGVDAALADLYEGKKLVVCPLQENTPAALARIEGLWRAAGADCQRMSALQHDAVFAAVSHLPHLLSFALVAQIANADDAAAKFAFAGAGFRDFTRIAASSPEMWRDICVANRSALLSELELYQQMLARLATLIRDQDGDKLEKVFARASAARSHWGQQTPPAQHADPATE